MSFWRDVGDLRAAIKANVKDGKGDRSLVEAVGSQRQPSSGKPVEQIRCDTDEPAEPLDRNNGPAGSMIAAGKSSHRGHRIRQGACWVIACWMMLGGALYVLDGDRWLNERVYGALLLAGGIVLLPPSLVRIRLYLTWTRHWSAPVMFWFGLVVLSIPLTNLLRPSLSRQHSLRMVAETDARRLLASGDAEGARTALKRYQPERSTDPQLAALFAKIDLAANAPAATSVVQPIAPPTISERPQSAEANFAERAESYWIPQTRAISTAEPDDLDSYHARLRDLDVQAEFLHDGFALNLDRRQRAIRDTFSATLAAKQSKLFPVLRRAYGKIAGGRLFRQDIRVSVAGPKADTLRLTGAIFVRNANIADIQEGLVSELKAARFRGVEYRWSRYFNETTSYKLDTPSDTAVGTTTMSGEFERLKN